MDDSTEMVKILDISDIPNICEILEKEKLGNKISVVRILPKFEEWTVEDFSNKKKKRR